MTHFYAEVMPALGGVRLVLDVRGWSSLPDEAQVRRYLADPDTTDVFTLVRSTPSVNTGSSDDLLSIPTEMVSFGVRVWYDLEAPLDVPVWYRCELIGGDAPYVDAAALVELRDSTFDTGLDGWAALTGTTAAHDTATVLPGTGSTGSLRLTSAGTDFSIGAATAPATGVAGGRDYIFEGWFMAPADAVDVQLVVDWSTAGGVGLGTGGTGAANSLPAGVWVYRRTRVTAPATTGRYVARVRWSSTPPAAAILYVDAVRVLDPGTAALGAGSPVVVPSGGGGWLRDPLRPRLDVRLSLLPSGDCDLAELPSGVIFAAMSAETRAGAGARFDVVDQAEPMVATSVRKAPTATLTLATMTTPDRDRVHDLLASGGVTLLQVPPVYGIPQRYCDVADVLTSPLSRDLRTQYRVVDLPHAATLAPTGAGEAPPGYRWADQCGRYATWDAIDAAHLTGIDVLLGAATADGGLT